MEREGKVGCYTHQIDTEQYEYCQNLNMRMGGMKDQKYQKTQSVRKQNLIKLYIGILKNLSEPFELKWLSNLYLHDLSLALGSLGDLWSRRMCSNSSFNVVYFSVNPPTKLKYNSYVNSHPHMRCPCLRPFRNPRTNGLPNCPQHSTSFQDYFIFALGHRYGSQAMALCIISTGVRADPDVHFMSGDRNF